MAGLILRGTLRATPPHARRVTPVPERAARGPVAEVYSRVVREFSVLAPPVGVHSPAPGPLAAAWVILRESLIATGALPRSDKEAVAAAVSLGNSCPYCIEVHSATMHGLVRGRDALAIADDDVTAITDPRLRQIAGWARASGVRENVAALPLPAATPAEASELIGVAVTFHYYNRVVNAFLADSPFPPAMPSGARGGALRMFGRLMRPAARRHVEPGGSLDLLPAAQPPPDLAWAAGSPTIADAFARAITAVDAAADQAVAPDVRHFVAGKLATWDGEPPGISRSWADHAVAELDDPDRPAARLALLTAMSSFQIDDSIVDAVRQTGADDQALVSLVSWAALTASRRIGTWLTPAQDDTAAA